MTPIPVLDLANLPDADVVALAQQGREPAYRELIRRYERPVFSLVYRMVRDRELAEDLTQDTFVKVLAYREVPRRVQVLELAVQDREQRRDRSSQTPPARHHQHGRVAARDLRGHRRGHVVRAGDADRDPPPRARGARAGIGNR